VPGSVSVAATRRVKDPAEKDGEEDEGDESAGQGPEHGAKHIGPARCRVHQRARMPGFAPADREAGQACSETCSLADGNAHATCMRRS
jgi:hypothetical protein